MSTTNVSTLDPVILAVFGSPPDGTDLSEEQYVGYDVVSCVVLGLAAAAVALRFWVRMSNRASLAMDDWTILIALIRSLNADLIWRIAGQYGSGRHIWALTIDNFISLMKVVFAEPWVYAASVTMTKVSILLLYRRLFYVGETRKVEDGKPFVIAFWMATFFTCVYPFIMWIVMACACRPLSFYWRQYSGATDGKCIQVLTFYLAFGIVNMINDIFVLVVPIPRITRLQMNKRKKASVAGIMLLGSFTNPGQRRHRRVLDSRPGLWLVESRALGGHHLGLPADLRACFVSLKNRTGKSSSNQAYGYNSRTGPGNHSQTPNFMQGQSHFRIEDDEVELTDKNHFRSTQRSHSSSVSRPSTDDHGITVKTQIQVMSTGK
ncbi:hypothetical protein G7054_g13304 [Neopestalotiopsis clavispora]|nr:hypothetical protein G7054_g13304 [Neopestalotiopsis clavispora]